MICYDVILSDFETFFSLEVGKCCVGFFLLGFFYTAVTTTERKSGHLFSLQIVLITHGRKKNIIY